MDALRTPVRTAAHAWPLEAVSSVGVLPALEAPWGNVKRT